MTEFIEVEGLVGVYSIHKGNLRSVAIRLSDQSLCVVSPIAGLSKSAYDALTTLGPVRHALAPNHYHNKGLTDFVKYFPKAKFYATSSATDRLTQQTDMQFSPLSKLSKLLNSDMTFMETQGLKTGEVWVRICTSKLRSWIVVDAFCGPKSNATGSEADTPELLKTFPNYGIKETAIYCAWVKKQLQADKPKLLIPCHGSIVRSPKLPAALAKLIGKLGK